MHLFVTKRIDRQLRSKQQTKMLLESLQVKRGRLFCNLPQNNPLLITFSFKYVNNVVSFPPNEETLHGRHKTRYKKQAFFSQLSGVLERPLLAELGVISRKSFKAR